LINSYSLLVPVSTYDFMQKCSNAPLLTLGKCIKQDDLAIVSGFYPYTWWAQLAPSQK